MEIKKRTRQDDIIEYLMNSKRELQQEIRNDVHNKEFKDAIKRLRAQNNKAKDAI